MTVEGRSADAPIWTVPDKIRDHEHRIGDLEDWQAHVQGATDMIRWVLGASVLGVILSAISLAVMVMRR